MGGGGRSRLVAASLPCHGHPHKHPTQPPAPPPPPSSLPGILEYLHELKELRTNITKYPLEKLAIEFNKSALDDYKAGQGGGLRTGDWAAAGWVGEQATRPPGPPIPHPLSPLP